MIPDNLDINRFIEDIYGQAQSMFPAELPVQLKTFVTSKIKYHMTTVATALSKDKISYSVEQSIFICQVVGEWIFHKGLDIHNDKIPEKYWENIIKNIVLALFKNLRAQMQVAKSQDEIIAMAEKTVQATYASLIKEISNKEKTQTTINTTPATKVYTINFEYVSKIYNYLEKNQPEYWNIIKDKLPDIEIVKNVLIYLSREKVSIKNIKFVLEKICEYSKQTQIPSIIAERYRTEVGKQICLSHIHKNDTLYAITLSPELEKFLEASIKRTEMGIMLALNVPQAKKLVQDVSSTLQTVCRQIGTEAVILAPPRLRLPLYQLLQKMISNIVVMSYSELSSDLKVEGLAVIEYSN